MKKERTSYAFLMEMIWVCAFFLICACIFVLVFMKAEQLSRQAEVLNQAVQAASNAMEEAFAKFQNAVDPDLVDSYIYEENAAKLRYQFLMKQLKNNADMKEQEA